MRRAIQGSGRIALDAVLVLKNIVWMLPSLLSISSTGYASSSYRPPPRVPHGCFCRIRMSATPRLLRAEPQWSQTASRAPYATPCALLYPCRLRFQDERTSARRTHGRAGGLARYARCRLPGARAAMSWPVGPRQFSPGEIDIPSGFPSCRP